MARKILIVLAVLAGVWLAHTQADAGYRNPRAAVEIAGTLSQGDLGYAHDADSSEYIECTLRSWHDGFCRARDAAGNYQRCTVPATDATTTGRASTVRQVQALGSLSHLYFHTYPASGNCGLFRITNGSAQLPADER